MKLSSKFLAHLCWDINYHFGKIDVHTKFLLSCSDIKSVLSVVPIQHYSANCMLYSVKLKNDTITNIIGFKSTDSEEDWNDNYNIIPVDYMDTSNKSLFSCFNKPILHGGFYRHYNLLKADVEDFIETNNTNTQTIITGFSLGGALATICSFLCNLPNTKVITFGSPRVGNRHFVKQYLKCTNICRFERWVFDNDPVPRLPPGFGYKHIPGLKLIDSIKNVIIEVDKCCYCGYFSKTCYDDHDLSKFWDKIPDTSLVL